MVQLIKDKNDAHDEPYLTFIVGATMDAPENRPEICGFLSVYEKPDGTGFLFTEFNQDANDAMKIAKYMAEKNGIQYIWVREFGEQLPQKLWK